MAKDYPSIDISSHVRVQRIRYGIPLAPYDYKVTSLKKLTYSTTSKGWPVIMAENTFNSSVSRENWKPGYSRSGTGTNLIQNIVTTICPTLNPNSTANGVYEKSKRRMFEEIPSVTANLALLYAERKKTMESIAIALGGILKCVREVRKGKVPELFMTASQLRTRKKFTGAWLNYVYGIKPFCSDLYAIAHTDNLKPLIWISGTASNLQTFQKNYYSASGVYRVKHKFGLSLADPIVASLAQTGMTNQALIAWELTPFSFMGDWLLPVGPYLEMLGSTSGYNKHAGSVTVGWNYKGYAWDMDFKTSASHNVHYKTISRTTMNFPNVPLPRFKNPYSPIHALNALSIIHQLVKDK